MNCANYKTAFIVFFLIIALVLIYRIRFTRVNTTVSLRKGQFEDRKQRFSWEEEEHNFEALTSMVLGDDCTKCNHS